MNKYVRLFIWPLMLLLIATTLFTTSFVFHHKEAPVAHAASSTTPSLSLASTTLQPFETVSASGQGFTPYDTVGVYMDSANGFELGALFCDGNGLCTGSLFVPYQGVLQGNHTLLALGSNNLQAQLSVRLNPGMKVRDIAYNTQGGPGTSLQVLGGAFQANETVQVFWGSTSTNTGAILEGSPTTDGQGTLSFSFNAPIPVAPGHYHIYVVRTGQKPGTLVGTYTILNPGMVTSHTITANQSVYVSVKGFGANEQVTVSWDANGGQVLGTFTTDETGSGQFTSSQVSTYMGTYTLTVTGNSSHITLTHAVRALAQVELSTYSNILPASTIQAFGNGFLPNESLLIYMDLNKSAGVTMTTDSTGAFSVTLAVPSYYKTSVNNQYGLFLNVYAVDTQQQKIIAKNGFNLAPLVLNSPYGTSTTYGQPVTLDGYGFAANATVKLYWNYHLPSQIILGTVQADSNGTFSITVPTPSSPNLSQVPVAAIDVSSKLAALSTYIDQPGITLNPPSGIAGSLLNISGGSFGANEPISISFGSITLPTVTTDTYGLFTTSFQVPAGTGTGIVTIAIKGATSSISLNTGFEYMPLLKITPTEGIPGTTVTLMGQYFGTSGAQISLVDPATGTSFPLGFAYLPGDGLFFDRVNIPTSGLATGIKYEVQVYDQSKCLTSKAPFTLITPGAQSLQVAQTLTVPGSTANVTGSGFTPGEVVQVYFQNIQNGTVQTTADSQGNISTSLKLPTANFTPKKSYQVVINIHESSSNLENSGTVIIEHYKILWKAPCPLFNVEAHHCR